jgi:hypothetical protein
MARYPAPCDGVSLRLKMAMPGQRVEVGAVFQYLPIDFGEVPVLVEEAGAEVRALGPDAGGEAYEVAGGQVVAAVLEVDQADDAVVTVDHVAGHEVEMAGDGR